MFLVSILLQYLSVAVKAAIKDSIRTWADLAFGRSPLQMHPIGTLLNSGATAIMGDVYEGRAGQQGFGRC